MVHDEQEWITAKDVQILYVMFKTEASSSVNWRGLKSKISSELKPKDAAKV